MKKCLFLLFMLVAANALATTYRWTDAQGNVHYSDQPPPKGIQAKKVAPGGSGTGPAPGGASAAPGGKAPYVPPSKLKDVAAVPFLTEGGRNVYRDFLQIGGPRAFVLCTDGTTSVSKGQNDAAMSDALQHSLAQLRSQGHNCRPYAVNDSLEWEQ